MKRGEKVIIVAKKLKEEFGQNIRKQEFWKKYKAFNKVNSILNHKK